MKFARLAIAAAVASLAMSAQASTYNFNVLYSGNNTAALAGGSDDPVGQSILGGDSFLWTITAQAGAEWQVISTAGYFPLMAFAVNGSGARDGDWTLTLKNNGADVFATSETNSIQEYVHMGTNEINLNSGLVFDAMELHYTLNSFTPGFPADSMMRELDDPGSDNVIQGLLPIFGAPEMNTYSPGIIYAPVPEPSSYALALAGLAIVAGLARRRRSNLS